jgi:dTDP-glucose 4,6-dehydratase
VDGNGTVRTARPVPASPLRVFISGGAGFLGSHLCDRLIGEGCEVICADNLLTGSLANIAHLRTHPNFTLLRHDVSRPIDWDALLRGGSLDYVLHLASPASPKDYARYPIETLKVGSAGTYNVLELAKATSATFLLASTSEVYGDPLVSPQPETYWGRVNSIGERSVYDEAKRFAEAITMAYRREYGLDVRIVRIFNTYGPRMRPEDGRALPNFITQALRGQPLTVYGDGSQTRSFCYVDDLIEGIYRYMLLDPHLLLSTNGHGPRGERLDPPVLNLGNPQEVTMHDLARQVIAQTGSLSRIVFRPLPSDDPKTRCPDITRAQQYLGWLPQVSRADGIRRTVAYFREQLGLAPRRARRAGAAAGVAPVLLGGARPVAERPA